MGLRGRVLLLAAVAVAVAGPAFGQTAAEPVAIEAQAAVPLDDETRVVIKGVRGDVQVRVAVDGPVRFQSKQAGPKGPPAPLAVFADHGAIRLEPAPGTASTNRVVEVAVPARLAVRVEMLDGGALQVTGLGAGLEIKGRRVTLRVAAVTGGADLDLEDGSAVVSNVRGDVHLRGHLDATVQTVEGLLDADMTGGVLHVREVHEFDGNLDATPLTLQNVSGVARLQSRGGSVEASELVGGADFRITGAAAKLSKCKGEVSVSSDNDVQFSDMEAALHFDVYGGSVRGKGNEGLVEVRTRNAAVILETIDGPVRIQGDGLQVKLTDVAGETIVYAGTSEVTLDNMNGAITVEAERGDVVVSRVSAKIHVKSRGGNVKITDALDGVTVDADCDLVEVSWTSTPREDSTIKNEGGDVVVRFASGGTGGAVDAESTTGRVETDLPRIVVSGDGSKATGQAGLGLRPNFKITARGDVQLLSAGAPQGN